MDSFSAHLLDSHLGETKTDVAIIPGLTSRILPLGISSVNRLNSKAANILMIVKKMN